MALHFWPVLISPIVVLSAVAAASPYAYPQAVSGEGAAYSYSYSESIRDGKGVPFSAEIVSTTIRTLADGTHITEEQKRLEMRDSRGRTRNESYLPDSVAKLRGQPADQPMFITIMDPVSGQHIRLMPQQKTATVISIPAPPTHLPQRVVAAQPTQPLQPRLNAQSSRENLGGKTIDGIYAEGTRITTIYPAGAQGNDRDITVVTERWMSPDLGLEVLVKTSDPRSGESTTEVRNLSRAEPEPALFQVPADYKVQSQPQAKPQQ